jgi:hypothetical protein
VAVVPRSRLDVAVVILDIQNRGQKDHMTVRILWTDRLERLRGESIAHQKLVTAAELLYFWVRKKRKGDWQR